MRETVRPPGRVGGRDSEVVLYGISSPKVVGGRYPAAPDFARFGQAGVVNGG